MKQSMMHAAVCLACASPAFAGVTITVMESGSDVVMSGGGSLDTSLWTFHSLDQAVFPLVYSLGAIVIGQGGSADVYVSPVGYSGSSNMGLFGPNRFADSASGDLFGIFFGDRVLFVPPEYVSGAPLSGSATYLNQSLASLGLDMGSYTWMWDTGSQRLGEGGGTDFFTVNVVPAPSGVLALMGLAGLSAHRRRRAAA